MGILDYLHPSDRDDLLKLLRNAANSGDNPSGTPPRSADLPSPLDSARWPVGPVGAPPHTDASMMSPAPFGFVLARLSGGVFNSTPAAQPAPPQACAARGDGSGQQHAADGNAMLAAADGWLNGVPVVGPYLISLSDRNMAKARAERYGTRYDDELAFVRGLSKQAWDDHPYVSIGSGLAAGMTSLAPFGLTAAGARLLGLAEGPLGAMMARGAATGAAIGGADAAARGARGRGIALGAGAGFVGGLLGAPTFQRLARRWPESAARFTAGLIPRGGWFLERHSASQQTE